MNYISILASVLILLFVDYNVYLCCHIYSRNKICLNQLTDGRTHGAPYRGHEYVPLIFAWNVIMRMGTQQNQLTDDLETWYVASGTQVLPGLFK